MKNQVILHQMHSDPVMSSWLPCSFQLRRILRRSWLLS
uniref:Uncharacterized protein n=1 Tax=Arundo donax TaxID=35708 RepID=A0A0A9FQK9_ARUDO